MVPHDKRAGHRAHVNKSPLGVTRSARPLQGQEPFVLGGRGIPKDSPPTPTPSPSWGGVISEARRVDSRAGLVVRLASAASRNGYKNARKASYDSTNRTGQTPLLLTILGETDMFFS